MKVYTIDVGNTRTHTALIDGSRVLEAENFSTSNFLETLNLKKAGSAAGVSWCSVVPSISPELEKILNVSGIKNMCLDYINSPIPLDMKNPEQVGQDRLASALGASVFVKAPYIVVDMGTAVTIDVVDARGIYAGGAIAPGLHAFVSYLNEKAAQLPEIDPRDADFEINAGKNTVEAMHVGCVKGFCRLVDGIIKDLESEFFEGSDASAKTVFTGGSTGLLPHKWLNGRKVVPELANIGLAKAFEINLKE